MTLYRKYRAQTFDDLYGQDPLKKVLKQAVKEKKWGHAYLFTGPRGTGKTSTARILAKAINCLNPAKDGNPCNKCQNCTAIVSGNFLDLVEVDAASNRGIEEIRSLKEKINFNPTQGKYKVYIIDEVHMLTNEAFNALLKTLEEPPAHIVFMLATTEPHKILPTIISRCQRFDLKLASEIDIISKLKYIANEEKRKIDDDSLLTISRAARGSFRDAETILEKVFVSIPSNDPISAEKLQEILGLADVTKVEDFIDNLIRFEAGQSLEIFHQLYESGVSVGRFLDQILESLRFRLLESFHIKNYKNIKILVMCIKLFSDAHFQLRNSAIDTLPVELAIADFISSVNPTDNDSAIKQTSKASKSSKSEKEPAKKVKENIVKSVFNENVKENDKDNEGKNVIPISFDSIKSSWSEILKDLKNANFHLSAFLQKSIPIGVEGDTLKVQVPFKFHKEKIEQKKSQDLFGNIAEKFLGQKLMLSCIVAPNNQVVNVEPSSANVADILGDILN